MSGWIREVHQTYGVSDKLDQAKRVAGDVGVGVRGPVHIERGQTGDQGGVQEPARAGPGQGGAQHVYDVVVADCEPGGAVDRVVAGPWYAAVEQKEATTTKTKA